MTEQIISELQSDFSSAGIEFLRIVEIKSRVIFDFIKDNIYLESDENMNNVFVYIELKKNELNSLEAKFAFNLVMSSLLNRGKVGVVVWGIQNFDQIRSLID